MTMTTLDIELAGGGWRWKMEKDRLLFLENASYQELTESLPECCTEASLIPVAREDAEAALRFLEPLRRLPLGYVILTREYAGHVVRGALTWCSMTNEWVIAREPLKLDGVYSVPRPPRGYRLIRPDEKTGVPQCHAIYWSPVIKAWRGLVIWDRFCDYDLYALPVCDPDGRDPSHDQLVSEIERLETELEESRRRLGEIRKTL
jgi:hypothetical protein